MKRSHRVLFAAAAMAMTFCMILTAMPKAEALFGKKAETAVTTFSKSQTTVAPIGFTAEDFTSRVTGSDELVSVVISELPAPESGLLTLAGKEVVRGQQIDIQNIAALTFTPVQGTEQVHTNFTFYPVFKKAGTAGDPVGVAINLSEEKNSAPVALDLSYETYTDLKLVADLKSVDPDGDSCTYSVVTAPAKGTVEVFETGFAYSPSGKSGSDEFTYIALDAYGNPSQPATVSISINKRPSKDVLSYVDMEDSTAHYAAVKLSEAGVFTGEKISGQSFLYPQVPVTRTEFVAMAAVLAELPVPTASVSSGLADNSDIPVWAQGFVVSAVSSGVVFGDQSGDGNRVFRANDTLTRAEAACILDRCLSLANDNRTLSAADAVEVPEWAMQSVVNTTAAGIVPVFADSTVRPTTNVTREDAINMLYQAMSHLENSGESSGILGLFK